MLYESPFTLDQNMLGAMSLSQRGEIIAWLERNGIEGRNYGSLTVFGRRARLVTVKTDRVFEVYLRELPPEWARSQ